MAGFQWYPSARKRLYDAADAALVDAAQAVLDDLGKAGTVPFAPAASREGHVPGRLAESGTVDATRASWGRVRIVFDTEYAARVYYHPEWDFSTEISPNARGGWLEPYIRGDRADFVRAAYAKSLRKRMRGR